MKRILQILILLFVFYYIIQIIFDFTNKGYDIQYSKKIDNNEFNIILIKKTKKIIII